MTVPEKRPTLTLPDPHFHSESLKPKSPSPRATPPRHDSNDTGRAQSSTERDRHAEKSHHHHHSSTRSKTKVDEPRSKHDGGESRHRREPAEVRPTDSKKGLEQRESRPRQESSESKSKRLQRENTGKQTAQGDQEHQDSVSETRTRQRRVHASGRPSQGFQMAEGRQHKNTMTSMDRPQETSRLCRRDQWCQWSRSRLWLWSRPEFQPCVKNS